MRIDATMLESLFTKARVSAPIDRDAADTADAADMAKANPFSFAAVSSYSGLPLRRPIRLEVNAEPYEESQGAGERVMVRVYLAAPRCVDYCGPEHDAESYCECGQLAQWRIG